MCPDSAMAGGEFLLGTVAGRLLLWTKYCRLLLGTVAGRFENKKEVLTKRVQIIKALLEG